MKPCLWDLLTDNIARATKIQQRLFKALIRLRSNGSGRLPSIPPKTWSCSTLQKRAAAWVCLWAFETVSRQSMGEIGKSYNKIEEFKTNIKRLQMNHGIIVLAHSYSALTRHQRCLKETWISYTTQGSTWRNSPTLTPLPGTHLHKKLLAEGRIIDTDWRNTIRKM